MGYEGLLAKPWNLRNEDVLREFLFDRGNQWFRTIRHDLERWIAEVWADVYMFMSRKGQGWAGRKDTFFAWKFRVEHGLNAGFYSVDSRNPRERRVIEFIIMILNPEKPKYMSITMANTIIGALSGARLVDWGWLIQEFVEKSLPHIGKKPSPLSPYILHLYQHNGCIRRKMTPLQLMRTWSLRSWGWNMKQRRPGWKSR